MAKRKGVPSIVGLKREGLTEIPRLPAYVHFWLTG
jgi:hypothetical protein